MAAAVEEIRLAVDFWVKSLALINDSSAPELRGQRVLLITQDPERVCVRVCVQVSAHACSKATAKTSGSRSADKRVIGGRGT